MHRRHAGVISSDYWDFQPGERVMTIDGLPGVVDEVQDGPVAGNENYIVTLDHGMGGGNYSSSMLAPLRQATAAEVTATGIHLAAEDYPELGTIVQDRPDPGKLVFEAAKVVPSAEQAAADAEDHDEEDPVAIDTSLSGAPATGEVADNSQPSSCSYCGGTEFENLRDNGRVRQATCATCKGTMSAHPGLQWTPELIGDPSNHPSMTVDPHSGASPAAGASGGVSGINDSTYSDATRVGKLAAAEDDTCPTCKGKGAVTWHDVDPHWEGDPDDNPGVEHTDVCDDCEGKGRLPEASEEELAEQHRIRQERQEQKSQAISKHLYQEHQGDGAAPIWENVKNCPRSCPVVGEYARRRAHGSVNTTLLRIAGVPSLPDRVASSATTAALEARMGKQYDGPHQLTLRLAQDQTRGEYPELTEKLSPGAASEHLRQILRAGGHPDADDSYVTPHRDPDARKSQTAFGGWGEPVVALHPDRMDLGTVAHEAGHHLHIYHGGVNSRVSHPDAVKHGPEFVEHYRSALNAAVPGAGDVLHTRYHEMLPKKLELASGPIGKALYREDFSHPREGLLSAVGRLTEQMREKLGPGSANPVHLPKTAAEENWVGHRPPGPDGTGAPLHDLNDVHGTYGGSPFGTNSDVYTHPQHWTGFHDHELDHAIKSSEGKPDAPVTIYRAQPAEHHGIRSGDWVTTSANYAHLHGSDGFDGPVHVVKAVVPAHHVWTNADDIAEAGYHGPHIEHAQHHADVEGD